MEFKGGNETPSWKLKWDAISDAVWESLRGSQILEEDDDESRDDMFFTPPESPSRLDPGFEEPCLCLTGDSSRLGFSLRQRGCFTCTIPLLGNS